MVAPPQPLVGRTAGLRARLFACFRLAIRRESSRRPAACGHHPVSEPGGRGDIVLRLSPESVGSVPERPKGTGCKPVGSAYGGSNPPRPTTLASRTRAARRPPRISGTRRARGTVPVRARNPPHLGRERAMGNTMRQRTSVQGSSSRRTASSGPPAPGWTRRRRRSATSGKTITETIAAPTRAAAFTGRRRPVFTPI